MHSFGDQVPPALENDPAIRCKVNADVGAVNLFFDDQRFVCNEAQRFRLAQMSVIWRTNGTEKVRRPGIFDETVTRSAHWVSPVRCPPTMWAEGRLFQGLVMLSPCEHPADA